MSDTITIKIETETNEPIAFIHETPARYGHTVCYSHIGQHSEAHNTYERFDCEWPKTPQDIIKAFALVQELKSIGYVIEE